jgi:predicted lipoprotein with Yx(FWY)xxD motif
MIGDIMHRAVVPGLVVTAAFALAACGGSSSASSSSSSAAPAASGPATSGATVASTKAPLGTILVDGQGRTLYLYTPDTSSVSTCTGGCSAVWPPLTTQGAPQAKGGVDASKLGTSKRPDGTTQVTYAGHPVYTFATGTAPGDLSGQGFQGIWYVVGLDGAKITATKPSTGSGTSSSSGGGWG